MTCKIVSIEKEYMANDINQMRHLLHMELKYNKPVSRNAEFIDNAEAHLAEAIAVPLANYNNGLMTTAEFISVISFWQNGELT